MTAAHENLYNYNPGLDETTQRGRRGKQVGTLAAYVLGCDDGSYARPKATDGYLVAVFHPTEGESAEPFTAVMGMRAHLDQSGVMKQARLDELSFFILQGETLSQNDFIDQQHIVPITDIFNRLKQQYGARVVEQYSKKRPYLRRLYAALKGKKDAVSDREAMHAAKTFSSFMAYKPVKSINDFVAHEILERKDMGDAIRDISEAMKTIHGMEEDASAIIRSIETLDKTGAVCQQYISQWVNWVVTQYTEARRQTLVNQNHYLQAKKQQQAISHNITEHEQKILVTKDRYKQAYQDIVRLEASRQGIKALKDKDELTASIEQYNQNITAQSRPLLEQQFKLQTNTDNCKALYDKLKASSIGIDIPAFDNKELLKQLRAVVDLKEKSEIDMHSLMGNDWIDMSPLEQHLDNALEAEQEHNKLFTLLHSNDLAVGGSLRDQLQKLIHQQDAQLQQYQQKIQSKQQEIDALHKHRITYPPYVQSALKIIRQQCPEADPRVLCDYIEVTEPQWQMAIEGYLGGARFSILVAEDYEAEAIQAVRSLPGGNRNRARVIQGSRARADMQRLSVKKDSVVEILRFEHKIAEYYIKASYGNVVRVPDAQALRMTPRGITDDGLASGSYSMWRCDLPDSELVFGQGARQRALVAKQAELDLSDYESVEQELAQRQLEYETLEKQKEVLDQELGGLKVEQKKITELVKNLDKEQDKLQSALEEKEQAVEQIARIDTTFKPDQALEKADKRAQQAGSELDFSDELDNLQTQLAEQILEIETSIMEHNQLCKSYDAIESSHHAFERNSLEYFKQIQHLADQVDNIKNRLKNNVLAEKQEKLTALKEDFNTAFATNLCHSIYQAINDGKRILDDLNRELEHHRFGTDQERFRFAYTWVMEPRCLMPNCQKTLRLSVTS